MGAHKLYFQNDYLEELIISNENHLTVYNIVDQFCDVVLNINEEAIIEIIKENPILKTLFKRENVGLIGDKEKYNLLAKEDYSNFLNDILLLNLSQEKTKNIREKFGILAFNLGETFIENQNYHFGYAIDNSANSIKCWSEIFNNKPIAPINSAILIDNFLWNEIAKYKEQNEDNIYPILENLIPKTLAIPFHLMIVLQNKGGQLQKEKAKEIINKIRKRIVRKNGLEICIVTQTDTSTFHERIILTNFHYIYSHKGFVAFANGRVKNETNGDRNWVFKDICNYVGQIRKHHHLNNALNVFKLIQANNKNETSIIYNQGNTNSPILSNFK